MKIVAQAHASKVPISCTQVIAEPCGDRGLEKTLLENRIKVGVATEKRWGWELWVCEGRKSRMKRRRRRRL